MLIGYLGREIFQYIQVIQSASDRSLFLKSLLKECFFLRLGGELTIVCYSMLSKTCVNYIKCFRNHNRKCQQEFDKHKQISQLQLDSRCNCKLSKSEPFQTGLLNSVKYCLF